MELPKSRERLKAHKSKSKPSQYYGIGAVIAIGALAVLGYYVYQSKKGNVANATPVHQSKEGNAINMTLSCQV